MCAWTVHCRVCAIGQQLWAVSGIDGIPRGFLVNLTAHIVKQLPISQSNIDNQFIRYLIDNFETFKAAFLESQALRYQEYVDKLQASASSDVMVRPPLPTLCFGYCAVRQSKSAVRRHWGCCRRLNDSVCTWIPLSANVWWFVCMSCCFCADFRVPRDCIRRVGGVWRHATVVHGTWRCMSKGCFCAPVLVVPPYF